MFHIFTRETNTSLFTFSTFLEMFLVKINCLSLKFNIIVEDTKLILNTLVECVFSKYAILKCSELFLFKWLSFFHRQSYFIGVLQ